MKSIKVTNTKFATKEEQNAYFIVNCKKELVKNPRDPNYRGLDYDVLDILGDYIKEIPKIVIDIVPLVYEDGKLEEYFGKLHSDHPLYLAEGHVNGAKYKSIQIRNAVVKANVRNFIEALGEYITYI